LLDQLSDYLGSHAEETTAMVVTYGGTGLDVKLPFSASPAKWKTTLDAIKQMPSRGLVRASEQRRLVESIKQIQRHGDSTRSLQGARDQLDELIGSVRTEAESMRMDGSAALRAAQTLVSVLSTVQGPKSLLYVGDGVPIHPGEDLYNLLADVFESDRRFNSGGGTASTAANPGSSGDGSGGSPASGGVAELPPIVSPMAHSTQTLRTEAMSLDLTPELRALTATANSHRVTIYGLSSNVEGGAGRADMNLGSRVSASAALTYDLSRAQVREQSLQLMAGETGGLALPPSAGVASFMDRVLADEANRYSLAYVSPHGGDSRFHKIKVKVNRKGVELRHREGYIDRPREVRVGDLVAGALLLGWTENPHQLEMEVVSQAPAENGETAVTLRLHIPIDQLRLVPAGEQHEAKLDLFILSKDAEGTFSPMRSVSFTVTLSPSQMAQSKGKFYGANLPLSLVQGPHAVAVGMVEPAAQRTSIVRTEIEVGADAPSSAPKG
jgi:VWFA-related protein